MQLSSDHQSRTMAPELSQQVKVKEPQTSCEGSVMQSFAHLWERASRLVSRQLYLFDFSNRYDAAMTLFGEAYCIACHRFAHFDPEHGPFEGWFVEIMKGCMRKRFQRHRKHASNHWTQISLDRPVGEHLDKQDVLDALVKTETAAAWRPSHALVLSQSSTDTDQKFQQVIWRDEVNSYWSAAQLTPEERMLLYLRFGEGWRDGELAQKFHMSPLSVQMCCQRTLLRVRRVAYAQRQQEMAEELHMMPDLAKDARAARETGSSSEHSSSFCPCRYPW